MTMAFGGLAGIGLGAFGWFMPILTALGFGCAMTLVVLIAPSLRWFVLKLTILSAAAIAVFALTDMKLAYLVILWFAALLATPSQHRWLNRYVFPGIDRASAHTTIARSVDTVWQVVRPVPGAPHWDPVVENISLAEEPDGLILDRRQPDGSVTSSHLQLLEVAPLRYLKIRDRSLRPVNEGGQVTVTAFRFDGGPEQCRLALIEATWHRPLWTAISLWMDDYLGDHIDHMAALIEERRDPSLRGAMLRSVQDRMKR